MIRLLFASFFALCCGVCSGQVWNVAHVNHNITVNNPEHRFVEIEFSWNMPDGTIPSGSVIGMQRVMPSVVYVPEIGFMLVTSFVDIQNTTTSLTSANGSGTGILYMRGHPIPTPIPDYTWRDAGWDDFPVYRLWIDEKVGTFREKRAYSQTFMIGFGS